MLGVFRFWGYGAPAWREHVGPGRLIEVAAGDEPADTLFGALAFAPEAAALLPDFTQELAAGVPAYVRRRPGPMPAGRPVVTLEPAGIPLVTLGDTGWRFHFDIDDSIDFVQQERYFATRPPAYVRFGVNPEYLPAAARKAILVAFGLSRGLLRRLGRVRAFPTLYKDFSCDVWRYLVRGILQAHAPVPPAALPLWPDGKRYAVVLNHDVDTEWGLAHPQGIAALRRIEEDLGLRSAWMVVTRLADAGQGVFADLMAAGHEIGCHGTVHDHAIAYLPPEDVRKRLAGATRFLADYDCVGFRSPSFHRSTALYAGLDGTLRYDMSMHDCFENNNSPVPSFEGCSTCFPFRIAGTGVLEIPTTVAEDMVLEMAGQSPDEAAATQCALIAAIARRGGVANLLTHPEPQLTGRPPWIGCYGRVAEVIAADPTAWIALPRAVEAWWTEREAAIAALWQEGALAAAQARVN